MTDDRELRDWVEAALGGVPAPGLRVQVKKGVVHLGGTVSTDRDRARVEQLVNQVEGVRGIVNDLVVEAGGGAFAYGRQAEAAYAVEPEELEGIEILEGPEPDLNKPLGTTDPSRLESDPEEPYFPPTDPVIEPLGQAEGGYRVLGGYSESAMDRPIEAEPAPPHMRLSDDQLAQVVQLALKEDAATTDLAIHVHVRDGVVFLHGKVQYLQDVESAEEVAGRVPGVREVREQLQLG